jgi:hypothetical protein
MEFLTINCCNQSFRFETHLDKSELPPKHARLRTVHSCKSRWISRLNMTQYSVKRSMLLQRLLRTLPAKVEYATRKEIPELAAKAFPA